MKAEKPIDKQAGQTLKELEELKRKPLPKEVKASIDKKQKYVNKPLNK